MLCGWGRCQPNRPAMYTPWAWIGLRDQSGHVDTHLSVLAAQEQYFTLPKGSHKRPSPKLLMG